MKETSTMPGQMIRMRFCKGPGWRWPSAWELAGGAPPPPCSTPGATATSDGGCGSRNLPISSISTAPASGNSGISQMRSRKFTALLPLQQIDFVGLHGFLVAEQRDQDEIGRASCRERV